MEYRRIFGKSSRWCRLQAILSDVDNDGKPHHFILAFQDIDKEKREQELKDTSLELLRDAYYRIGCIDLDQNSMITIKLEGGTSEEIQQCFLDFHSAVADFSQSKIHSEFKDEFCRIMVPENLRKTFDGGAEYLDFVYRRKVGNEYRWSAQSWFLSDPTEPMTGVLCGMSRIYRKKRRRKQNFLRNS